MPISILTTDQLAKVRDAALRKAAFYEARPIRSGNELVAQFYRQNQERLIRGLRHTAADAQAAIDGCEESMRSVQEELDEDMDLARAAESYVPAGAA